MNPTSENFGTALAFLNALLPAEGVRVGVFIKDKKVQQAYFESNTGLAAAALAADAQGWDAYHACAVFGHGGSRKADNALGTNALWLDVDAGPGKDFASFNDALSKLAGFVRDAGVPAPCCVSSGHGIHAYWIFEEVLDPHRWFRLASALKVLTPWADQTRTADIASILRTPGTHNYKRGGKVPVVLGPLRGPYAIGSFDRLLHVPSVGGNGGAARVPQQTRNAVGRLGRVAAGMANIYGSELADADQVANGCAQLRAMRDTGGRLTEPLWKACLGVLAFCRDGEETAHEWSQGDPRYNEDETQSKYERSAAVGGPTTCRHFASVNEAGCSGCVFAGRISTPVQLGREHVQNNAGATATGSPVGVLAEAQHAETVGQTMPVLPPGFTFGERFELRMDSGSQTGDEPIVIARNPLFLVNAARGEIRKDMVTFNLRYWLPSEGWRDVEMPAATLYGAQGNAALAGKGILVENADAFKKFCRDSFNLHVESKKLGLMYEQCGWKENDTAFLAGTKLYRPTGVETISGTPEVMFREQLIGPRPGGSLDGWKAAASKLFRVGTEASTFAMLAGFAAPLIRFLSTTEGGAVVSVVSRESGQGKSVGIDGATSIWGNGEALRLINFDTQVARAITWGVLGNLPCVLDDIAHKDAEQARDFIQRFTDGRDKMRGTRDGEIRHLLANWQTILITSSNHSLVDMITSIGGTSAMAYRILHFEASLPADINKKDGERWRREMLQNWGYAGHEYLRYLVTPEVLAWAKQAVVNVQQDLIERHGYSTEHRFWTRTLACVFVAHTLIHKMGLVDFPPNVISDWAVDQTKAMANLGADKASGFTVDQENAVDVFAAYVAENIDHMLILGDRPAPGTYAMPQQPQPRGQIKIRLEQKPELLYVREDDLRKYLVKRQFSFTHFMAQMRRRGCLVEMQDKRSISAGTQIKTGPTRLLCFLTSHADIGGSMPLHIVGGTDHQEKQA